MAIPTLDYNVCNKRSDLPGFPGRPQKQARGRQKNHTTRHRRTANESIAAVGTAPSPADAAPGAGYIDLLVGIDIAAQYNARPRYVGANAYRTVQYSKVPTR